MSAEHAESGCLYVVATPIGNLEDITLRALRTLREVDLIAVEHAGSAAKLLNHYEIGTPYAAYHERGPEAERLLARLRRGESVALICDAGTPGVSDPGRRLVGLAAAEGIRVVPIPGAASAVALWSVAGGAESGFRFYGFLPRRASARRTALAGILEGGQPTMVFESPHRLRGMLMDLARQSPEAELIVGRELTKRHEQIWRGSAAEAVAAFDSPRGEFTLLITPPPTTIVEWSDAEVAAALSEAAQAGESRAAAARRVAAESGRPRREVYALWPGRDADDDADSAPIDGG